MLEQARVVGPEDALFRSQIRHVPKEARAQTLILEAAMWCFDEDPNATDEWGKPVKGKPLDTFYAIKLNEHYRPGTTYIKADTLQVPAPSPLLN